MYCRKCLKKEGKKVNMIVDIEKKRYVCPECGHVQEWSDPNDTGDVYVI